VLCCLGGCCRVVVRLQSFVYLVTGFVLGFILLYLILYFLFFLMNNRAPITFSNKTLCTSPAEMNWATTLLATPRHISPMPSRCDVAPSEAHDRVRGTAHFVSDGLRSMVDEGRVLVAQAYLGFECCTSVIDSMGDRTLRTCRSRCLLFPTGISLSAYACTPKLHRFHPHTEFTLLQTLIQHALDLSKPLSFVFVVDVSGSS
jgi:hypothetical protein